MSRCRTVPKKGDLPYKNMNCWIAQPIVKFPLLKSHSSRVSRECVPWSRSAVRSKPREKVLIITKNNKNRGLGLLSFLGQAPINNVQLHVPRKRRWYFARQWLQVQSENSYTEPLFSRVRCVTARSMANAKRLIWKRAKGRAGHSSIPSSEALISFSLSFFPQLFYSSRPKVGLDIRVQI